jgi:hypothetical protein
MLQVNALFLPPTKLGGERQQNQQHHHRRQHDHDEDLSVTGETRRSDEERRRKVLLGRTQACYDFAIAQALTSTEKRQVVPGRSPLTGPEQRAPDS